MEPPAVERLDPAADPALAAELVAVQVAAYRVEAELIGSDAIPPLRDTAGTLVAAGLLWLGCRDGDGVVGAVGVAEAPELVGIDRLVVAPRSFRRGIGRRLVAAVLDLAGDRVVTVSTGRDNVPARALYASAGFRETGQREVVPGLWTVSYSRSPSPDATSSTPKPSGFSR